MRPTLRTTALIGALLFAAGCDSAPPADDDAGVDAVVDAGLDEALPAHCENVNPTHCLMPWPSSFFLADDPTSATGRRVSIPVEAMPATRRGVHVDPSAYERADGFSPSTSIVTSFAGAVDPALLAGEDDIARTLEPDSTTVIVDVATGERVAHFAELDEWPATDPERAPLYLRPAARLQEGARYAVGIRGLRLRDGTPVEPSPYFAALRDDTALEGTALEGSDVDERRAAFEETFAALEAAGVPRGELVEAWSFETASVASQTRDMLSMRDAALEALGPDGLGCEVTEVRDADAGDTVREGVWRRISGTFRMPSFLAGEAPGDAAQSRLARGPDGAPMQSGIVDVPFLAYVPEAVRAQVAAGEPPGPLVVYGHGILGQRSEAESDFLIETANRLGWVIVATDWWGMSADDLPRLILSLTGDFSDFDATPERLHQGLLNALGLTRSFRGACASLDGFSVPLDGGGTAPAYAPEVTYFYGNSLGAILGGALAGVATDVDRFALGVGGSSWTMLIKRSDAWQSFGELLAGTYEDALERDLMIAMTAGLWDPVDPATYARHLRADPLPGTPLKHVMMQIGVGDVAVSNATAYYLARTAGLPLLAPSVEEPWGLEPVPGPTDAGLTVFALPGVERLPPGTRDPGPDTPTHNGVRRLDAAITQLDAFLRTGGQVIHPCDGPCDPD